MLNNFINLNFSDIMLFKNELHFQSILFAINIYTLYIGGVVVQLNQLKYLLVLSEEGSYMEAAKQLNISQATISIAMKNLQDELGYQVIQRTSKGIVFTEKGEQLLEKARLLDIELQKISKIKYSLFHNMSGAVHLAGASYGQILQLVDLIIFLQKKYPKVRFHIDDCSNMKIIEGVRQGKYLAGFLQLNSIDDFYFHGLIVKNNLEFESLESGNMYFCVSSKFPLLAEKQVELSEFLKNTVITSRYQMSDYFLEYFRQRGYQDKIVVMHDVYTSRRMVDQSEQYSIFLPEFGVLDSSTGCNSYIMPIKDFECRYTFGLIYRKNSLLNKEKELIHMIKDAWYFIKKGEQL